MYDSLFLYFPAEFLDLLFDFHFTTHLSLKLNISSKRRILPRFTNSHARTLTTIFEAIESSSFYGHYLSPKLFSPRCDFDPRLVQSMGGKREMIYLLRSEQLRYAKIGFATIAWANNLSSGKATNKFVLKSELGSGLFVMKLCVSL